MCSFRQNSVKEFCFLLIFVFYIENSNSFLTNNVRISREAAINTCLLPSHPKFGQWTAYKPSSSLSPGGRAPSGTTLLINCQTTHKLEGDSSIFCINGRWTAEIGQCLKKCPPLGSTAIRQVTCVNCFKKEVDCTEAVNGITAQFQCADFYESRRPVFQSHNEVTCMEGEWSDEIPECVPVCGQKKGKIAPTLIVNGAPADKNSYPWQVALYNVSNKVLLCGGSLVNQRVILTAAHCVTDDLGKLLPKDFYMVAAGKYYREFQDSRDANQTQLSAIRDMFIPKQYKGDSRYYLGDIAILVTDQTFTYSYWVQPVCVDWESKYQDIFLNSTKKRKYGFVSGWGFTAENSKPPEALQHLKVPFISPEECLRNLTEENEDYLTYDKLCAGYLNSGTSACKGDSGGGLVFRYKKKHYLVAIVSVSPQDITQTREGCNSQQYTLYTKISEYIEDFILQKEARIRKLIACEQDPNCQYVTVAPVPPPDDSSTLAPEPGDYSTFGFQPDDSTTVAPEQTTCVLPKHPEFGRWSVYGQNSELEPGLTVPMNTILKISCSKGYKLIGSEVILCLKEIWSSNVGQCLKTCSPIANTATLTVNCSYNKTLPMKNCNEAVDSTVARFECAPFYELSPPKSPFRICIDGSWNQLIPSCVPACGLKPMAATPLIIGGTPVKKGNNPWQVAIYSNKEKQLICSGSLINPKVILTAAHCVTDFDGKLKPNENFMVAVGKHYRSYNDSRDTEAQFSSVDRLFIPRQFKGAIQNYYGDIATIIAKQAFTLSSSVLPVCVDWAQRDKFENSINGLVGTVAGWGFSRESDSPSEVLKELKAPLVSTEQCSASLLEDFEIYLTSDKLCAGYLNGTSLCVGDSGGGLMVKRDGRFYIVGIASVSPASSTSDRGCASNQYGLYTRISDYIDDFILEQEAKFRSY